MLKNKTIRAVIMTVMVSGFLMNFTGCSGNQAKNEAKGNI